MYYLRQVSTNPLLRARSKRDGVHRGALEPRNYPLLTKVLSMGKDGLEEMLEQVIRTICAEGYRCKWHPDVIWYVPAGQMPSSGMTFGPFS
jgi:hypothetical protein